MSDNFKGKSTSIFLTPTSITINMHFTLEFGTENKDNDH